MEWIYLSPHFDDVALSCGGLLWEQVEAGESTAVWTVCAGELPPGPLSPFARSLHERWGTKLATIEERRAEDAHSCHHLGAGARYFEIPDCIYRREANSGTYLYASEESLFGELHPSEHPLVVQLRFELAREIPAGAQVVAPSAVGGHVDHRLVRVAAERLERPLWYYADYPYIEDAGEAEWARLQENEYLDFTVSEAGLEAWVASIAAHASQISTFWSDEQAMRAAIRAYHRRLCGVRLFRG
jgi:LmbE family N-acetylglucosaminyl deacetylase